MMPSKNSLISLKRFFLLLALGTCTNWALGRSAEDYLHGAAAKYIQGRLQEASVEVEEGIRAFPNDPKLKALAGQLKSLKDQKKQDQSGGGSQSGDESKQKEDKKDSSSQNEGQNKDQKKKDPKEEQSKGNGQDSTQQKSKEEEKKAEAEKNKEQNKGDSTGQAASQGKPGELSKEEAERLLNSYQDDEKREHQEMQRRQKRPVGVEKDW